MKKLSVTALAAQYDYRCGSLLVLFMLLFWIPLDMPLKFTLSWMKGAQTIEATSVKTTG